MNCNSNKKVLLTPDGLKILSLFDGMACAMLALIEAGIKVGRYVAYEIDKYAVQTTSHNFPFIEHMGDVFEADFAQYKGFDILMGGSPCTYWSIAQKSNRETEASGMGWELFCRYVKALDEAQPKYFIYENNKSMSRAIRGSINQTFGFEPICINSSLVSAQHRQRLYWVGKRNEDGTYSKVDVQLPNDRGILLQDVLDSAFGYSNTAEDKSYCLDANYWKTPGSPETFLEKGHARSNRTMAAAPVNVVDGDKSFAIKANYYKSAFANFVNGGGHYPQSGVAEPVRVGTWPNKAKNQAHDSQQYRIYSVAAKRDTLCGNGGGMGAKTGLYAVPVEFTDGVPADSVCDTDGKAYSVYKVKDGEITINNKQYPIKLEDGHYIIRKLTVSECMRLQTVPEWYEFPVSDTQAYKMLGNGWTVSVIAHLLNSIKTTQQSEI